VYGPDLHHLMVTAAKTLEIDDAINNAWNVNALRKEYIKVCMANNRINITNVMKNGNMLKKFT